MSNKALKIPNWFLSKNAKSLHLTHKKNSIALTPISLLDSCRCPQCFHNATNQRKGNIFVQNHMKSLEDAPFWSEWTISDVDLQDHHSTYRLTCKINNHHVVYDVEKSTFDENLISRPVEGCSDEQKSTIHGESYDTKPEVYHWERDMLQNELKRHYIHNTDNTPYDIVPQVHVSSLSTNAGMKSWIGNLIKYGFCMIDGVDPSKDEHTYNLINYIGHYKNTLFGEKWSFENRMDFEDTAYTDESIEPHTDNTYFEDPTRIFFLHCVDYKAEGGESTIIDAFKVVRDFEKKYPHYYNILTKIAILFHYKDKDHHYIKESPIIVLNSSGEVNQIRYNHHDRFHVHHLSIEDQESFFEAYNALSQVLHNRKYSTYFLLQPGSVLTFDNWRVLHGRYSFKGERRCVGFYSSSDDFESKARKLFHIERRWAIGQEQV